MARKMEESLEKSLHTPELVLCPEKTFSATSSATPKSDESLGSVSVLKKDLKVSN